MSEGDLEFGFNLSKQSTDSLGQWPAALSERVNKIVFQASNSAARSGRVIIVRSVKKALNLATVHGMTPADRIKKLIHTDYAHDLNHPEAVIRVRRKPVKLAYFKGMSPKEPTPSMNKKGSAYPSIEVHRGAKQTIGHSFVQMLKAGHLGIFVGVKGSRKIIEKYGPAPVSVLAHDSNVREQVHNRIAEVFERDVTRRIKMLADEQKAGGV